jgi:hypothetical protein
MKRTIPHYVIIIILIGIIFLQRECHRCPEVQTSYRVDTIPGDIIPSIIELSRPEPYFIFVDTGQQMFVDTASILRDYFARVVYLDTLKDDSSAFIAIRDTVTENRLRGRQLYFANRKPTAIIHTTTVQPSETERMKLYAGAMLALTPEDKSDIGPVIMMMTPKGAGYSYAYGVNEKSHTLTVVWKIKLRRKVPP